MLNRDKGNVHVLEAVLVAILLLAAVAFVLTFSLPSAPSEPVREDLARAGENALAIFHDLPLNDPTFGNSTLSKVLAESLAGDPANLTARMDNALPPGVLYNVYLSNGYGTLPVYESGTPPGESVSVRRLLEPRWSFTFLATDASFHADPASQGVYALPVYRSNPLTDGGVPVELVVSGERIDAVGNSRFSVATSYAVVQGNTTLGPPTRALSVNYVNATTGRVEVYRDADEPDVGAVYPRNFTFQVRLAESSGLTVPAGTTLTVHTPRGWTANATPDADWEVVANDTDPATAGALVARTRDSLAGGTLNLTYHATFHNDTLDLQVHTARVGHPFHGAAELVVREQNSTLPAGGQYVDVYGHVPRSLGTADETTWGVGVVNPRSSSGWDDEEGTIGARLLVDEVNVVQPDGLGLFASVQALDDPPGCPGTWQRTSASLLTWSPDAGTCLVRANEGMDLSFEVTGSGKGTPTDARKAWYPTASYPNTYDDELMRQVAHGFRKEYVPGEEGSYGGWDESSGTHRVRTNDSYRGVPLEGNTTYGSRSISLFRDALALGRVTTDPNEVAVGGRVTIESDLATLLLALSDAGISANVETSIYPVWSLGKRVPAEPPTVHEEDITVQPAVLFVDAHDLNGDGHEDVVTVTGEPRLYGHDGLTGIKLAGYQATLPGGGTPTAVAGYDASPGGPYRLAVGMEDGRVLLHDDAFQVLWIANPPAGGDAATDISHDADWTGDGEVDLVVGWEGGPLRLLDGATGAVVWEKDTFGQPARVAEGRLGLDPDHAVVATLGPEASVTTGVEEIDQGQSTFDEDGDQFLEDPLNGLSADLEEQLKKPSAHVSGSSIRGFDAVGDVVWNYGGGAFDHATLTDLDGNNVDEVVGGGTNGAVHAVNGTQGGAPYALLQILSGNEVIDLEALDHDRVYSLSRDGMFMFTDDAWTTRSYYWHDGINLFHFDPAAGLDVVDGQNMWIVGPTGTIYRTTDGSGTWNQTLYTLEDTGGGPMVPGVDVRYEDVLFRSDNLRGVLVGGDCRSAPATCDDAFFAYTLNGGANWTEALLAGDPEDARVRAVQRASDGTLWAVGDGGSVWNSTSDGVLWQRLGVSAPGYGGGDLLGLHFEDEAKGFVVGVNGTVLLTTDGGSSWARIPTPTNVTLRDVTFVDAARGWAVGDGGTVMATPDGGTSWVEYHPVGDADNVTGYRYNKVVVPAEHTGWFAGGEVGGDTRLFGHLPTFRMTSRAQSTPIELDDTYHGGNLEKIRAARVDPIARNNAGTHVYYNLSNDGCSSWVKQEQTNPGTLDVNGRSEWAMKSFPDPGGRTLCFRVDLAVDRTNSEFWGPRLHGLKIEYQYKETGQPWKQRKVTVDLTQESLVDRSASTSDWDTDEGEIRAPLVEKFWVQGVGGAAGAIDHYDANGDGTDDIVVGTGARYDGPLQGTVTGEDRRVYLLDGATGVKLATSDQLAGRVTAIDIVSLPGLTGDLVPDLLVTVHDPGAPSGSIVAMDGVTLGLLWTESHGGGVNDAALGDLDGDGDPEVGIGTVNSLGEAGEVIAYEPQEGSPPPREMWSAVPDLKGRYTQVYAVPRGALFGPYVVETEVAWKDDPGVTQRVRVYDHFVVTPPTGRLPASPVYGVELVMWYEDWT